MDPQRVADLLGERPDLEDPLRATLAVDAEQETWTYDDVDVDSGPFGELVSRGLVEKRDDEYALADPDAVRAALDDDRDSAATGESTDGDGRTGKRWMDAAGFSLPTPAVERRVLLAVGGLLVVLALSRTVFAVPAVFRGEHVVLSGNDPYYYRFWVEAILTGDGGVNAVPGAVARGEPLLVATLGAASALLGGSATAAGWVLAWYPVVSAVLTGGVVYLLTVRITRDRRIGLAALAMLVALPAHGFRTSLGFADHHAFDYVWLALSMLALADLVGDEHPLREARTWAITAGFGLAVAGQVLAWEAGPLLILPIGLAAVGLVLADVRSGRSPLDWGGPVVAGLAVTSVVTLGAHSALGWHTDTVVLSPLLLLGGVGAVVAVGVGANRSGVSWQPVGGALAGVGIGSLLFLRFVLPSFWAELVQELGGFGAQRAIAETQSLFGSGAVAWLLLFGLALFVAIPYLVWATRAVWQGERRWVTPVAYGWVLFGLTLIQIRFGGEASLPFAVFAGLGLVHLAEQVDLTATPAPFRTSSARPRADGGKADPVVEFDWPDGSRAAYLLALFLLIGGLGLVQVPVKTAQLTISDETYETATALAEYAEAHDLAYPDSYVLSQWSRNRVYNYFVNGESQSYGYARSNYGQVLDDGFDPPDRVGMLVVEPLEDAPPGSVHDRLTSYGAPGAGLAHYRAVVRSGETRAFAVVPGARVTGSVAGNSTTLTLATNVSVENWAFTYSRSVTATDGTYAVRVAHPGTYRIRAGGEQVGTVDVSGAAVLNGTRVTAA